MVVTCKTRYISFMLFLILQVTLIDPCIKGTLNVLSSCKRARNVRRVVLTSSCSSVRYRDDARRVSPLNETHWSDLEYCERNNVTSLKPLSCFWKHRIYAKKLALTHLPASRFHVRQASDTRHAQVYLILYYNSLSGHIGDTFYDFKMIRVKIVVNA